MDVARLQVEGLQRGDADDWMCEALMLSPKV